MQEHKNLLPSDYARCATGSQCPKRDRCLRWLAAKNDKGGRLVFAAFDPINCEDFLDVSTPH